MFEYEEFNKERAHDQNFAFFCINVVVLTVLEYSSRFLSCCLPVQLVSLSFKVWEESSGESLLQIQLLVALKNFVVALGYHSPLCYDMLLPILQKGIDINNPDEINLLEDSMLVSYH